MKTKFAIVSLLAIFVSFSFSSTAFGQSEKIGEKEYWDGIRAGYASTRKTFPRREIKSYEAFQEGKSRYFRKRTIEYHAADRFHLVTEVKSDGKTSISEMIQLGSLKYCKENAGEWKTSNCGLNPPAPLDDATETVYSREEDKNGTIYFRNASFLSKETGEKEPTIFLTNDRLALNPDFSVRDRNAVKSIPARKTPVTREFEKYEYNLKLKPLEAPIK